MSHLPAADRWLRCFCLRETRREGRLPRTQAGAEIGAKIQPAVRVPSLALRLLGYDLDHGNLVADSERGRVPLHGLVEWRDIAI
jgi:hypothetical protein